MKLFFVGTVFSTDEGSKFHQLAVLNVGLADTATTFSEPPDLSVAVDLSRSVRRLLHHSSVAGHSIKPSLKMDYEQRIGEKVFAEWIVSSRQP